MDPLSFTANVAGMTALCVQTVKILHTLKDKLEHANATVAAICIETTIISASLSRLQSFMLADLDQLTEKIGARPGLEATMEQALTGCVVVLDVLQAEIHKLVPEASPNTIRLGPRKKLLYLWNEAVMQDVLSQLRGLQAALTLLLQLFETENIIELRRLTERNTALLLDIEKRTAKFRSTTPSRASLSTFDFSFSTRSTSMCNRDIKSIASSTCFAFDSDIADSPAYRRVTIQKQCTDERNSLKEDGTIDRVIEEIRERFGTISGSVSEASLSGHSDSTVGRCSNVLPLSDLSSTHIDLEKDTLAGFPRVSLFEFLESEKDHRVITHWQDHSIHLTLATGSLSHREKQRRIEVFKFIASEHAYLRSLLIFHYIYEYRLALDASIQTPWSSSPRNFPGCEEIFEANRALLYVPFMETLKYQGPSSSALWEIFENWLAQVGRLYEQFASVYPMMELALWTEEQTNKEFSQFLRQSSDHWASQGATWNDLLPSPLRRISGYVEFISSILKLSNINDPEHGYSRLQSLEKGVTDLRICCNTVLEVNYNHVHVASIRSRMRQQEQLLLPNGTVVEGSEVMLYEAGQLKRFTEVEVLVINKPFKGIGIFKEGNGLRIKRKGAITVLAILEGRITASFKPYAYKWKAQLSDSKGTSISLWTADKAVVLRLARCMNNTGQAVSGIPGLFDSEGAEGRKP